MTRWQRWKMRWAIIRYSGESLNRRVEVENVLASVAQGKRPALTPEECRDLARKLGTPARATKPGKPRKSP